MKKWQVAVKISENPVDSIELIDVNEILDGYLSITRTFFDELLNVAQILKKYAIGKGIETVNGPDGKNWSLNPWLLVMIKDNENQAPFWLLLKREKDLSGLLVAVGPITYFEYLKNSKEADDEIKRLIEFIIAFPQKFRLSIIIPNFIN